MEKERGDDVFVRSIMTLCEALIPDVLHPVYESFIPSPVCLLVALIGIPVKINALCKSLCSICIVYSIFSFVLSCEHYSCCECIVFFHARTRT